MAADKDHRGGSFVVPGKCGLKVVMHGATACHQPTARRRDAIAVNRPFGRVGHPRIGVQTDIVV